MKFYLMPMIIGLLVIIGPDIWIYRKIRKRIGNTYLRYIYWLPALFFVLFFSGMRLFSNDVPDYKLMSHITWILWLFALIYLPKLFYTLFDFIGWLLKSLSRKISLWLSRVGAGVAVVLAILLLYGALVGRARVHVKQVEIAYDGCPGNSTASKSYNSPICMLGTGVVIPVSCGGLPALPRSVRPT